MSVVLEEKTSPFGDGGILYEIGENGGESRPAEFWNNDTYEVRIYHDREAFDDGEERWHGVTRFPEFDPEQVAETALGQIASTYDVNLPRDIEKLYEGVMNSDEAWTHNGLNLQYNDDDVTVSRDVALYSLPSPKDPLLYMMAGSGAGGWTGAVLGNLSSEWMIGGLVVGFSVGGIATLVHASNELGNQWDRRKYRNGDHLDSEWLTEADEEQIDELLRVQFDDFRDREGFTIGLESDSYAELKADTAQLLDVELASENIIPPTLH